MEPRWYTVLFWPNRDKNSSSIITKHVINQVKKFLRKSETEFPNKDSYKQLKKEILWIFGPRPETRPGWTSFIPGQGIERRNLPAWTGLWLLSSCHQLFVEESTECSSKAGIAHLKLTSATFNQITQLADVIHMYNLHVASSSMSSLNAVTSSGDQLNETQPGLPYTVPEVNAIKKQTGQKRQWWLRRTWGSSKSRKPRCRELFSTFSVQLIQTSWFQASWSPLWWMDKMFNAP